MEKKLETHRSLPTPEQIPDADVVIYDGHCEFCIAQVNRLNRLDDGKRLTFLSLHDPQAKALTPHLTHDQLLQEMLVVARSGQQFGGAKAFRYLTRRLPRLWLLAPFVHIPFSLPVWDWLYRLVARNRYRWNSTKAKTACSSEQCDAHLNKVRR